MWFRPGQWAGQRLGNDGGRIPVQPCGDLAALGQGRYNTSGSAEETTRHATSESGYSPAEGTHDQCDESASAEDSRVAGLAQHLLSCVFQDLGHRLGDIHARPKFLAQPVGAL